MKNKVFVVLFFLIFINFSFSAVYTLKKMVITAKKDIFLSSLACESVKLQDDVFIMRAPAPGEEIFFFKSALNKITAKNGIYFNGPEKIKIKRIGYKLSWKNIKNKIDKYLRKRIKREYSWELKSSERKIMLPSKKYTINIKKGPFPAGYVVLYLIVKSADYVKTVPVTVYVSIFENVVVAKNDLDRYHKFSLKDLCYKKKDISKMLNKFFTDKKELIGKRSKRTIFSGKIIKKGDVEEIPLVKRGSVISAFYQKGRLSVKIDVIAMKKGYLNDIIRVKIENSRKYFYAKVIGRNKVFLQKRG